MAADAYLPADDEIEAEHAWVNEWTAAEAAPAALSVPATANSPAAVAPAVGGPLTILPVAVPAAPVATDDENLAPTTDPSDEQLLSDLVEIAFARDMLEREVSAPPARRRIHMPVVVGGMLGLILVTAASIAAGLIKR
jgi:hypothetical protein